MDELLQSRLNSIFESVDETPVWIVNETHTVTQIDFATGIYGEYTQFQINSGSFIKSGGSVVLQQAKRLKVMFDDDTIHAVKMKLIEVTSPQSNRVYKKLGMV